MLKVQEIRELIKLIDQSSIDEFTYETNGTTVSMKKTSENNGVQQIKTAVPVEQQIEITKTDEPKVKTESTEVTNTEAIETEKPASVDFDYEIESPMVGTLYIASSPEADPFVQKGSSVQKDTVVCIVEAMKLFNEIEAEVDGEIVEVLVDDGELVEYGQPLFRVKTK